MRLPPLSSSGVNHKTQEYWTTIAGKKIYSKSLEALCRTVAYGWTEKKSNNSGEDIKFICIYCGREWPIISEPCLCLMSKGDTGRRVVAMKKLYEMTHIKKPEKKVKTKSPILLSNEQ